MAVAAALCIGLGAAGVLAIPRLLEDSDGEGLPPAAVETFDPKTPFDLGVELSAAPDGIATAEGSVWVAIPGEERVVRLDAESGEQEATVAVDGKPCGEPGYLESLGWIWFASCGGDEEVWGIDAGENELRTTLVAEGGIAGGTGDRFWTWSNKDHTVNLYDVEEGRVKKFRVWNTTGIFDGIAWRGKVWVTDEERGVLSPVDQRTGAFPDIVVGRSAADIEVGLGAVWVADDVRGTVVKVSPKGKILGRVRIEAAATTIDIVVTGDQVWARGGSKLVRIDPKKLAIIEKLRAPGRGDVAADEGRLWLADPEANRLLRLPVR
jgi:streptogramin lyase